MDAGYAYAWRGKLAAGLTCRYFRLDQKTLLTTYVACDLSLFYRDSLAGRPYFWQAGMQLSNIGEAYLPLKIEYAVSAGWEQGAHRVMCTGGIAHQELAYGFCTLGSAGVEYSFRKKIFFTGRIPEWQTCERYICLYGFGRWDEMARESALMHLETGIFRQSPEKCMASGPYFCDLKIRKRIFPDGAAERY